MLTLFKFFYALNNLTVSYLLLSQGHFCVYVIEKVFSPYFRSMNIIRNVPFILFLLEY